MFEMIQSLVILVTTLFQNKVEEHSPDIIDLRIRIFLTRFHRFDAPMRKPHQKPSWLSSYNFICLRNIPDVIKEFGPL